MRTALVASSAALLVTGGAAFALTSAGDTPTSAPVALDQAAARVVASVDFQDAIRERGLRLSRSADRSRDIVLTPRTTGHRFASAPLNLWTEPREQGRRTGLVAQGSKLAITGRTVGNWSQVVLGGTRVRWVNATYLVRTKARAMPTATAAASSSESTSTSPSTGTSGGTITSGGLSAAPCPDGSSIESGLTSSADAVYRAACAAFPQLTTYGGYSPRGEHADGRAIDIMTSGSAGWQLAEWLRANAGALNIRNVIYSQRIWTPEQASAGWRFMEDRGSTTANHYDHVHVAVY